MNLEDRRALVALSALEGFGRARLRVAVRIGPGVAWERCRAGREPDGSRSTVSAAWAGRSRSIDPVDLWERHRVRGVVVTVDDDPVHPPAVSGDPNAPPLLFWRGAALGEHGTDALAVLVGRPTVAVVGTRRATRYGLDVARRLGRDLADAGVVVVSGLAMGIDAAVHDGVVATRGAPPVAVVAAGPDQVHPRRTAPTWAAVERHGAIVSEYPLGTPPAPWRFPERNRVVVALSSAVVVVESHERGGSLITANLAADAGVPVLAVPGPVTSAASTGANRLLVDGCAPCLDARDVLTAVGLGGRETSATNAADELAGPPAGLGADEQAVWEAIGWEGSDPSRIADHTGLGFGEVSVALVRLQERRCVRSDGGVFVRVVS